MGGLIFYTVLYGFGAPPPSRNTHMVERGHMKMAG